MNRGLVTLNVTTGIILAALANPVQSTELGRVFFSPAERAVLEQTRRQADLKPVVAEKPEVLPETWPVVEQAADRPAVTVNGYVKRSSGPPTVWINGVDSYQGDLSAVAVDRSNIRIKEGQVRVGQTAGEADLSLKPGQTFTPATREVTDAYDPPASDETRDAP